MRGADIAEFARAVAEFTGLAESAPRHGPLIAPAGFGATMVTRVLDTVLAETVPEDTAGRILHVDQVIELRRAIREGDRLTCRTSVESCRHFADYHVLAIRTALVDHRGAVVRSGTTSLLTRIGGPGPAPRPCVPAAAERPARASGEVQAHNGFDALRIGADLAPWAVSLTGADLARYARLTGATGAAPSTIELALATTYLTHRLGPAAVPLRLRTQSARHSHHLTVPAPDHAHLEFRGRVTGLDTARGRITVALTARDGDRDLFNHATVDLRVQL